MDKETKSFESVLADSGVLMWRTSGRSMRPLIKTGRDLVIIEPPKGRPGKYDVAFYKTGGTYILHRILKVKEDGYITAGDNNYFRENIKEDQMLGVMTGLVRRGKKVDLNGLPYRAYVLLWGGRYGLRRAVTAPYRYLRRFAAKLFHKVKGE